ncbi:flagellar protein FlbD [Evansella caseinilytica]|uniref:Flagellar protein FlbD n=1 Tax=Evansella caseinilytica TaxID=1503961 RepID=A0A1H3M541_9BACI|nr:flagellar FlbD family protein [Evansella caseinilytica]SDY71851.1 flagellar protein FlbD [Evansella caseinilytica]
MIQLTKLNDDTFTLNAIYIEQIQAFPDTTITLTNGKRIVVKDSEQAVVEKVMTFYQNVGLVSLTQTNEKEEG